MSIESWLLGTLGLNHLVSAGEIGVKIIASVKETEAGAENAIADGAKALAIIEGIAANPTNIANDLAALPALIADAKAGYATIEQIITVIKGATATTTTKAVSVVTVHPTVLQNPPLVAGTPTPLSATTHPIPVGELVPPAPPLVPEVTAPAENFPATTGEGSQGLDAPTTFVIPTASDIVTENPETSPL